MSETLEQAAENYSKITLNKSGLMSDKQVNGFIAGAKWQQERSYSEEEIYNLLNTAFWDLSEKTGYNQEKLDKWFEQFKKK